MYIHTSNFFYFFDYVFLNVKIELLLTIKLKNYHDESKKQNRTEI